MPEEGANAHQYTHTTVEKGGASVPVVHVREIRKPPRALRALCWCVRGTWTAVDRGEGWKAAPAERQTDTGRDREAYKPCSHGPHLRASCSSGGVSVPLEPRCWVATTTGGGAASHALSRPATGAATHPRTAPIVLSLFFFWWHDCTWVVSLVLFVPCVLPPPVEGDGGTVVVGGADQWML